MKIAEQHRDVDSQQSHARVLFRRVVIACVCGLVLIAAAVLAVFYIEQAVVVPRLVDVKGEVKFQLVEVGDGAVLVMRPVAESSQNWYGYHNTRLHDDKITLELYAGKSFRFLEFQTPRGLFDVSDLRRINRKVNRVELVGPSGSRFYPVEDNLERLRGR
ncbi:MAG: hypothetical protein AB7F50_10235 [Fimbriimonadaceae bacterium]